MRRKVEKITTVFSSMMQANIVALKRMFKTIKNVKS